MKPTNNTISASTKSQNKTERAMGFSHKKYSTKIVNSKYNKPIAENKSKPFISSLK
ncbi:MAG: hypothetical protein WC389_18420 [Lutibacter sp.]